MASKNFGKAYETDKKRHKTETHLFTYSINKTKMTCEEFRKNLIELCDKDVNPELRAALAEKPAFWRSCGAGGLRDTTRVSAGDPEVWRAIFEENRNEILPALDAFAERFDALRSALRGNDSAALLEILAAASAWRRPLSLGGGETEAAK